MNGSRGVAMDYHLVELRLIHIQPLYNMEVKLIQFDFDQ